MATVRTPAGDELEVTSPAELFYYRREPGYLVDGVDETDPDYVAPEVDDVEVVDDTGSEDPVVDHQQAAPAWGGSEQSD
jgi:hypothetical protein